MQIFTTIDFHFAIFAKEISRNGSRTQVVAKREKTPKNWEFFVSNCIKGYNIIKLLIFLLTPKLKALLNYFQDFDREEVSIP